MDLHLAGPQAWLGSLHNKPSLRKEAGGVGGRWAGLSAPFPQKENRGAPWLSAGRKERPRALEAQRQRMSDFRLPPTSPLFHCPEPLGQSGQNQEGRKQKAHNIGVHEDVLGRCGRPHPPVPLPQLLGQGGLQQLQYTAHQVQASCDQHVDGSSLTEYAGPVARHGVGEEALWGTRWLKDRVPALADPLQGMGDAAEDKGASARGVGGVGCQQQGYGPTRLWARGIPEVRAGLLFIQATPVLLVFQAAEQHLVQGHCEILLICKTQEQAHQRGGWEWGGGRAGTLSACLMPGPSRALSALVVDTMRKLRLRKVQ